MKAPEIQVSKNMDGTRTGAKPEQELNETGKVKLKIRQQYKTNDIIIRVAGL
jgi:hypothetical protein